VAVIWDDDREVHLARHQVTIAQAEEALADPDALVIEPDYASLLGLSTRTIGFSPSFGDLISVITYAENGLVYGATAFRAKGKDRRYYEEGSR